MHYRVVSVRKVDGTEVEVFLSDVLRVAEEHKLNLVAAAPFAVPVASVPAPAAIAGPAATPPNMRQVCVRHTGDTAMLDLLSPYGDVVELTDSPGVYTWVPRTDAILTLLISEGVGVSDIPWGNIGNGVRDEYRGYVVNQNFWNQDRLRARLATVPKFAGIQMEFYGGNESEQAGKDLKSNDVKVSKSFFGWFYTLDKTAEDLVRNLKESLSNLTGFHLANRYVADASWIDSIPDYCDCAGAFVLRIQRIDSTP